MSISDRLDETTEQSASVIGAVMSRWDMDGRPDVDGGIDTLIASALAEAGLLAPAPLREEWGVRWDDHDVWGDMYNTRHEAETGAGDEGTPVHRYVTDWEKA